MKISDTVLGAGFVAAGALIIAGTLHYPTLDGGHPGPALFPRILGALMAGFGGLVSLTGLRARDETAGVGWTELHRNPGFVNALFVLGGVAERLGYLIMGSLIMFVIMWRIRVPVLRALVIAVAFNNLVYLLFAKVMRVPLPLGLVWW